ncbi:terpenoid synthase [Atractiella rhizophila]|nr:terpenoid synthase [Atractiella rhizophila]
MASGYSKTAAKEKFLEVWPTLRDEVVGYMEQQGFPQDAKDWMKRNLDYNTPGGKLNRGMSVVDTVRVLKGEELTKQEYFESATLGWCIELLQAYFLVADDMMDQSITRRGQPCWYKQEGVGNIAINDSFMLEGSIYFLLKKHFRNHPAYVHFLEVLHDTTFQTEMGQLIDLLTAPEDHVDLSKFSLQKQHQIVVYKTSYYSFYLPVALGMRYFGLTDEKDYETASSILLPLGEYFQCQDDYLDCYGDPKHIGKIGTDILDNKCSWNINIALAAATPEQRKLLDENYGRKDSEKEKIVKRIFNEVDLPGKFQTFENESYAKLNKMIDAIPADGKLKPDVFREFLAKVYKRSS